jgi:hypothetical protein
MAVMCWAASTSIFAALSILLKEPGPLDEVASDLAASVESHSQERLFRTHMHNLVRITYPVLWVAVFARQLCLPVPAIFFLMTAGALAGRGELRIGIILAVSTLGCLAADLVWFQQGDAGAPES